MSVSPLAAIPTLTQTAYETLRADVLSCRLLPDERLRINLLCARLGVSLSAVREALARLTSEGLVVATPQRGFRVAGVSVDDLRDLTRVRIDIEGLCLRSAMTVGTIAWEADLLAAFHRLSRIPEREDGDPARVNETWAMAHAEFHAALVAACDSPWLLRLRALLYSQSERYRRLSVPLASAPRDLLREHRQIMDATLARNVDQALALMAMHLETTTYILLNSAPLRADPVPARAARR